MNLEQWFSICFNSKIHFQNATLNGTPCVEYKSRVAEFGDRQALGGPSAGPLRSSKHSLKTSLLERRPIMDGWKHGKTVFASSYEEFFKSLEVDYASRSGELPIIGGAQAKTG